MPNHHAPAGKIFGTDESWHIARVHKVADGLHHLAGTLRSEIVLPTPANTRSAKAQVLAVVNLAQQTGAGSRPDEQRVARAYTQGIEALVNITDLDHAVSHKAVRVLRLIEALQ